MPPRRKRPAIPKAARFVKLLGGPSVVALHCDNISRQAVHRWKIVPSGRARTIAKLLGISPAIVRPDLYGEI